MQKTVLIVEDEFLIAMDLKLLLEHHGWRVMGPVATVQGALRLLEEELPSVTLVAETLKTRAVPFVLASAYDRPEQFGGEVLVGAPNVGKPTGELRLLAALGRLTEN